MKRLEEWLKQGRGNYLNSIEFDGKLFEVSIEYSGPRKTKYRIGTASTLESAIDAAIDAAEGVKR